MFGSDGILVGSGGMVGMVVIELFGCFLMDLLGLWLYFVWFVAMYLLSLWWVWGHGGCCVEMWLREIISGGVVERVGEIRERSDR